MKGYKTIIFNSLVALFAAALVILPTLQSAMTTERYAAMFLIISTVNALLRAVSNTPIFKDDNADNPNPANA
jgi:hypothetical protein